MLIKTKTKDCPSTVPKQTKTTKLMLVFCPCFHGITAMSKKYAQGSLDCLLHQPPGAMQAMLIVKKDLLRARVPPIVQQPVMENVVLADGLAKVSLGKYARILPVVWANMLVWDQAFLLWWEAAVVERHAGMLEHLHLNLWGVHQEKSEI